MRSVHFDLSLRLFVMGNGSAVFTAEGKTPRMTPVQLFFRVPFPAPWPAAAPVPAQVRELWAGFGTVSGISIGVEPG